MAAFTASVSERPRYSSPRAILASVGGSVGAGGVGGSALQIRTISENLLRTREITAEIIADHTGKPLEEIYEATSKDSWFEAPEAVAYGLADRVIERI